MAWDNNLMLSYDSRRKKNKNQAFLSSITSTSSIFQELPEYSFSHILALSFRTYNFAWRLRILGKKTKHPSPPFHPYLLAIFTSILIPMPGAEGGYGTSPFLQYIRWPATPKIWSCHLCGGPFLQLFYPLFFVIPVFLSNDEVCQYHNCLGYRCFVPVCSLLLYAQPGQDGCGP